MDDLCADGHLNIYVNTGMGFVTYKTAIMMTTNRNLSSESRKLFLLRLIYYKFLSSLACSCS